MPPYGSHNGGEVLEWPNRHDWKSCVAFTGDRGFESHPLRQLPLSHIVYFGLIGSESPLTQLRSRP